MKLFLLLLLFFASIFPQNLSESVSERFIHSLIYETNSLKSFILPNELTASEQLGINYNGVNNKFLISNNIDPEIKDGIKHGTLFYDLKIDFLKRNYSRLTFAVPEMKYQKEYYFKDSFLVSAPFYFSDGWKTFKSRYFEFHVSDPSAINDYSMQHLDNFVAEISKKLDFSPKDLEDLSKNKIKYFLCKDEAEIKNLTGFNTMGIYYLSYDYLITTYNSHYHELLHLLMNFKLKTLPLYTLPFFQEGFAVAYGGRGGKEPEIFNSMAVYLQKSGFISYREILNKEDFSKVDPSISYPLSGLYNKFLIEKLGIGKYLELYKKYSSDDSKINKLVVDTLDLPSNTEWEKYLNNISDQAIIKTNKDISTNSYNLLIKGKTYKIYSNTISYLFAVKDTVLLTSEDKYPGYVSSKYQEIFPVRKYDSQKYLITADSNEVSVYNLFTNNLIAKYVSTFSIPPENVYRKDGFYLFTLPLDVFDNLLNCN